MKLKDALRPAEVAEKLGLTEDTILGWREMGMPWVKIGKQVFILESSFMKWIQSRETRTNAQDAPGQEFFGRSIGEVIPPKS